MNIDDVKSKVQKLLTRTMENGCTESEVKVALAKAHELLARYNMSMDDLVEETITSVVVKTDTKSLSPIQAQIAVDLAPHFGVVVLRANFGAAGSSLNVIAEKDKCEVFKEIFLFTYNAFKSCWKKYSATLRTTTQEKNLIRGTYLNGFMAGLISEVAKQESEKALIICTSNTLKKYMDTFTLSGTHEFKVTAADDAEAYYKGYQAGKYCQVVKGKAIE